MDLVYKILKEFFQQPTVDAEDKLKTILEIDSELPETIASIITHWFRGTFMGNKLSSSNEALLEKTFEVLQKTYGKPSVSKIYRALHLRVKEGTTEEQILKMSLIKTGVATFQSWSSTKAGAMWYYNHFAIEQNNAGKIDPEKAWVLVEATTSSNLNVLVTASEMTQYLSDCSKAVEKGIIGFADSSILKRFAKNFNSSTMIRQHEVICKAKENVPVKIIKVMIPPGQKEPEEEDDFSSQFEEILNYIRANGFNR